MASPKGIQEEMESGEAFAEVNASRELNLGVPEDFPVDPVSSEVETAKEAKQLKEEAEARAAAKALTEADKCDAIGQTLMSALVVSAVLAAAIGVAIFVTKKFKET